MELIFIFFIILLLWLLRPVLRLLWTIRQAKRQFSNMQEQARKAAAFSGHDDRTAHNSSTPPKRRKVFDKTVGEYVEFEEVACSATTATESTYTQTTVVEEQITDAEWEEI